MKYVLANKSSNDAQILMSNYSLLDSFSLQNHDLSAPSTPLFLCENLNPLLWICCHCYLFPALIHPTSRNIQILHFYVILPEVHRRQ